MIRRLPLWSYLLGVITTPLFLLAFIPILPLFHPLLLLAYLSRSSRLFQWTLQLMNLCVLWVLRISGTHFTVSLPEQLPAHGPLILVSNHQSIFDIPLFIWFLRRYHPRFVAKRELGRWIPSASLALRAMNSLLIDRTDPSSAIPALESYGRWLESHGETVCIFPEGTRAKDGTLKRFKSSGLRALLRNAPSAAVLPVVIENSWHLVRYRFFPVPFGIRVHFRVLAPVKRSADDAESLPNELERVIANALGALRSKERSPA